MTRPEAGDDYGYGLPDDYDRDAWQEFTPWRPGDQSVSERPAESAGPWWTETCARSGQDQATGSGHRFREGEQVRSVRGVGGTLGGAVPAGTVGKVVSVRHGLFDERVTVEFVNGYRQEVSPDAIKYESGWY